MLTEWLKSHIENEFPEFETDKLFIAVSGGIDSIVLCHLMHELGYSFTVLHCNFKLREAADEDEQFVKNWALERKVPFESIDFDTKSYATKHKLSTQMAARELRYNWFEDITRGVKNKSILLAHHRDDLVETFLINLSRSAGISGLSGIPKRRGCYKRPLLAFSKKDIKQYATNNKIRWAEDASNQQNDYLRNHIRNKVIPNLEEKVPHINTQIASSVNYLKEIDDYMKAETEQFLKQASSIEKERHIISLDSLSSKNKVLLSLGLLQYGFKNEQSRQILGSLDSIGKQFNSKTHVCLIDRNRLIFYPIGIQEQTSLETFIFCEEGSYSFNSHQFVIKIHSTVDWTTIKQSNAHQAFFDLDSLSPNLHLRYWKQGDSMSILGMKGRKMLSDLFIDVKVSLDQKSKIPIILSNDQIIWCCGIRQSSVAQITSITTRVLEINFND